MPDPADLTALSMNENAERSWVAVPVIFHQSFVYRLMLGDACVYVGQTTKGMGRVYQHLGEKVFDRVEVSPCAPEDLSEREALAIQTNNPALNKTRPVPRWQPHSQPQPQSQSQQQKLDDLMTVAQLADSIAGITANSIRWDLFNRDSNGLSASSAIVRRGRRILIDRKQYMEWMRAVGAAA
jgi:hypothetical protein